jgi:hypothetical protein
MEATVDGKAVIWRGRIEAQRASGQSVRACCRANGSREHSFFWWRARLGLSPARRPAGQPSKPIAFARVIIEEYTSPAICHYPLHCVAGTAWDRRVFTPG